jgi:hypothetical protein
MGQRRRKQTTQSSSAPETFSAAIIVADDGHRRFLCAMLLPSYQKLSEVTTLLATVSAHRI